MTLSTAPVRYRNAVIPHAMVENAAAAIEFYASAFGAEELLRIPGRTRNVAHAEMAVEGSRFMLGDADLPFSDPLTLGRSSVALHIYVKDVDALFERAVSAGATALSEPRDQFYGDRMAMLEDPFGHIWVLLTHLEDLTDAEISARATNDPA